jgi:hypothetical protein
MTMVTIKGTAFWKVKPCFETGSNDSAVRDASSLRKRTQRDRKKNLYRDRCHELALQLRKWATNSHVMLKDVF